VTSTTRETFDLLAEIIHRTMCYRGTSTPTCKSDRGDGLIMARELDRLNLKLVVKEPKQ
jgi:hypothetical protein